MEGVGAAWGGQATMLCHPMYLLSSHHAIAACHSTVLAPVHFPLWEITVSAESGVLSITEA